MASQLCSYLVRDAVIFEELIVPSEFHGFALDEDGMNAFGGIFEEF